MDNWFGYSNLLEMAEALAEYEGWISSEEELSEKFDNEVAPLIVKRYGKDDSVAMNQAFNNWTDSLCRNGEIHAEQYDKYIYVGKYSDE